MDPITRKKLVEKIQALLRMAEGKANHNESATAARQAEALMRKFNLEMHDVILQDLKDRDSIGTEWSRASVNMGKRSHHKRVPPWAQWLATGCAKLFDCEVHLAKVKEAGAVVRFVGYSTDVQVCKWTFDYLIAEIRRLSKVFIVEHRADTKMSDAYRNGMCIEVRMRLQEAVDDKQKAAQAKGGTAMVLMSAKKQAIEEAIGWAHGYKDGRADKIAKKLLKEMDTEEGRAAAYAYVKGREDGKKVNISPNPVQDKRTPQNVRLLK